MKRRAIMTSIYNQCSLLLAYTFKCLKYEGLNGLDRHICPGLTQNKFIKLPHKNKINSTDMIKDFVHVNLNCI